MTREDIFNHQFDLKPDLNSRYGESMIDLIQNRERHVQYKDYGNLA